MKKEESFNSTASTNSSDSDYDDWDRKDMWGDAIQVLGKCIYVPCTIKIQDSFENSPLFI